MSVETIRAAIEAVIGEYTPPTEVLQALAQICGDRKRQWMQEGLVDGSTAYENAEQRIDELAAELKTDYIGEVVKVNEPDNRRWW